MIVLLQKIVQQIQSLAQPTMGKYAERSRTELNFTLNFLGQKFKSLRWILHCDKA